MFFAQDLPDKVEEKLINRFQACAACLFAGCRIDNDARDADRELEQVVCRVRRGSAAESRVAQGPVHVHRRGGLHSVPSLALADWFWGVQCRKAIASDVNGAILAPVWQADDTSDSCLICKKSFTFFKRRHHCRYWCANLLNDD